LLNEDVKTYIQRLKPDIVVKGKEHEEKYNKELEVLQTYGGKLLFTSGEISFSSMDLLKQEFLNTIISNISHDKEYLNRHGITPVRLKEIIDCYKDLNVMVIGDTIIDEYIANEPLGMSQEDPTIVVRPISSKKFIGGASIVAAHAKTMGANVEFISVVGEDENQKWLEEELEQLQISQQLFSDATRPTTLKQRHRAKGKTLLRVNHFKQHTISKELEESIVKQIQKSVASLDLIILSDFSYGIFSLSLIEKITQMAKEHNIKVVADSQSSSQIGDIAKFNEMVLVTPTEREIRLALNDFKSGLVVLSEKLIAKSKPKYIFTTLGSEGVLIYNNQEGLLTDKLPALSNIASDVSGAGDSLLTCASMALSVGATIWEAAYLGSLAAAIQVSRVGNIPIKKSEIMNELDVQ
jgi:rfaE bifunctional protein kinase chain/domain